MTMAATRNQIDLEWERGVEERQEALRAVGEPIPKAGTERRPHRRPDEPLPVAGASQLRAGPHLTASRPDRIARRADATESYPQQLSESAASPVSVRLLVVPLDVHAAGVSAERRLTEEFLDGVPPEWPMLPYSDARLAIDVCNCLGLDMQELVKTAGRKG